VLSEAARPTQEEAERKSPAEVDRQEMTKVERDASAEAPALEMLFPRPNT